MVRRRLVIVVRGAIISESISTNVTVVVKREMTAGRFRDRGSEMPGRARRGGSDGEAQSEPPLPPHHDDNYYDETADKSLYPSFATRKG